MPKKETQKLTVIEHHTLYDLLHELTDDANRVRSTTDGKLDDLLHVEGRPRGFYLTSRTQRATLKRIINKLDAIAPEKTGGR